MKKKVVGLGEVLWDILPGRTCLGGAPANFAYIATLLGDEGIVASRVGEDDRGREAIRQMKEFGLNLDYVQKDLDHSTGTVSVVIDNKGMAQYDIALPVAWDFLDWTGNWRDLAECADAVCFGSLAQRSERSRKTIQSFLRSVSANAARIFDVNLRQSYYSREVIEKSMMAADIVKLNDEEMPTIMRLTGVDHTDELSSARNLIGKYDLKLVCITRGGRGSLLVRDKDASEHSGFRVQVVDTVGSGDAFTAGLVHEFLQGASLDRMNETANRFGAWVATQAGAMPVPKGKSLEHSLASME